MKRRILEQIIDANKIIRNAGGHMFVGDTNHDPKQHGYIQLSELVPFEKAGRLKRFHSWGSCGGGMYVRHFEVVEKVKGGAE